MDLRSKLARLDGSSRHRLDTTDSASLPGAVQRHMPVHAGDGVRPDLDELRARLAAMMARSRTQATERTTSARAEFNARLAAVPLPFDQLDTADGPLHVRTARHAGSARVGNVPVAGALDVPSEVLRLLSLDAELGTVCVDRALYLDTESTGLAGGTGTIPFLVGLGWFEDQALVVEQLLLRNLGDEVPLLRRLKDRIEHASLLVTFNGKAFDLPLLRTRFVMNRVSPPREPPHLDLVHVARRVHRAGRRAPSARHGLVPATQPVVGERWIERGPVAPTRDDDDHASGRVLSCKLVALERHVLGFERENDVPSGEIPGRYAHFLRTGDADAVHSVCDHNLWDVVSMTALLGLYGDAVARLAPGRADDPMGAPQHLLVGQHPVLGGRDFVGIARCLKRAGDLPRARMAADTAVRAADRDGPDSELGVLARWTRGHIAKGARDVSTAVDDFEHVASTGDREARLELAKLYEHKLRSPDLALEHLDAGTTESAEAEAHRRARLVAKAARNLTPPAGSGRRKVPHPPSPPLPRGPKGEGGA